MCGEKERQTEMEKRRGRERESDNRIREGKEKKYGKKRQEIAGRESKSCLCGRIRGGNCNFLSILIPLFVIQFLFPPHLFHFGFWFPSAVFLTPQISTGFIMVYFLLPVHFYPETNYQPNLLYKQI